MNLFGSYRVVILCVLFCVIYPSTYYSQITCTNPNDCSSAQSDAAKFSCLLETYNPYQGDNLPQINVGEYVRMYLAPGIYTWSASANDGNCGSTTIKLELRHEDFGAYVYTNSDCSSGTIKTTDGAASGIYIQLVVHPCMEGWYLLGTTRNSGVLTSCQNCTGRISGWSNSYSCSPMPSVTAHPAGTTLCPGVGTATFTITATDAASYQWQYNNGGTWQNVSNGTPTNASYAGATTASLTVSGNISGGPYSYRCKVTSSAGCYVYSNSATLTINSLSTTPTASASPASICVPNSSTLSRTSGTLGTGASWKWYTGSCGGTHIGTGASIVVSPTVTTTYYVRAEGTCNTTSCATVTVTVGDPNAPVINVITNPSP